MLETKEFKLEPEWEKIDSIQDEVMDYILEQKKSEADSDAIGMIASELLENAIKYGQFSRSQDIELVITINSASITVEVTNPIDDTNDENIKRLDERIQWIRGFQNPFEAYIRAITTISSQHHNRGDSGLGLVRVAYEGHAIIDFYMDDSSLYVSAVYNL